MRNFPHTLAAVCALLASCSQPQPVMTMPGTTRPAAHVQSAQRQYLALPGQPAVRVGTEDADAAFDQQVNAYAGGTQTTAPRQPIDPIVAHMTGGYGSVATTPAPTPAAPAAETPTPVVNAPAPAPAPSGAATPGATADYAVQITNGTAGRIFVEAQDAAGHIFPCGPMFGGQSINTPPDPVGPLKGPITVVVRDPDKDGAPEIRRYQVQPPANYKGKTVGITILPGGQYRADVDKEVYYTSPAPVTTPDPAAAPAS